MFGKSVVKFLLILLALSILSLGIGSVTFAAAQSPEEKYLLYYIPHAGAGDPFWACEKKGWEAACRMLPVKGIFAAPPKYSLKKQVEFVWTALAAGADGIVVTIGNPEMFREPLEYAKSKDVPVLVANTKPYGPPEEKLPFIGYVGQDETLTGEALAKRVLEEFTPTRAVIGIHQAGLLCLELRAKGIMEVLGRHNIPVEKLNITPEPSRAIGILDSYLMRHQDTDVIFTLGPLGTAPSVRLIREKNLKGKVRLATMDVDDLALEAIEKGEMIATIAQQPFMQGFLSAISIYLHLAYGYMPPENLPTGPTIIDKSSLPLVRKQLDSTGGA